MTQSSRLLLVDDDEMILKSFSRALGIDGTFEVFTASTADGALEEAAAKKPDIILLDIHLGEDVDGIECARRLRNNDYRGPIFMLTGDASMEMLMQAALAGADDYLIKGDTDSIVQEVKRLHSLYTERIESGEELYDIADSGFLRSLRLEPAQAELLAEFAKRGFPREKELANQLDVSQTSLWKRLSRIREKLDMDCMSQITHMLTTIRIFGYQRKK